MTCDRGRQEGEREAVEVVVTTVGGEWELGFWVREGGWIRIGIRV